MAELQRHENKGMRDLVVAMLKSPCPYVGECICHARLGHVCKAAAT